MSSLGSSVINKSSKKAAPKAPPPREPPGAGAGLSKPLGALRRSETPQINSQATSPSIPATRPAQSEASPDAQLDSSPQLEASSAQAGERTQVPASTIPAKRPRQQNAVSDNEQSENRRKDAGNKRQRTGESPSSPQRTGNSTDDVRHTPLNTHGDPSALSPAHIAAQPAPAAERGTAPASEKSARQKSVDAPADQSQTPQAPTVQSPSSTKDATQPSTQQGSRPEASDPADQYAEARSQETASQQAQSLEQAQSTVKRARRQTRKAQQIEKQVQQKPQQTEEQAQQKAKPRTTTKATRVVTKTSQPNAKSKAGRKRKPAEVSQIESASDADAPDAPTTNPWDNVAPPKKRVRAARKAKAQPATLGEQETQAETSEVNEAAEQQAIHDKSTDEQQQKAQDHNAAQIAVKKPRKPRKDKGTKRGKKSDQPAASDQDQEPQAQAGADEAAGHEESRVDGDEPATTATVRHKVKRAAQTRRKKKSAPTIEEEEDAEQRVVDETRGDGESEEGEAEADCEATAKESSRKSRARSRRENTSSDDEDHRINSTQTSMWDLTLDSRKGQVSHLERAFRKIDWAEVKRKQAEAKLRLLEADEQPEADGNDVDDRLEQADEAAQGRDTHTLKVINGELRVEELASREDQAQANAEAEADAAENAGPDTYEESELTQKVNSQSWVNAHKRDKRERVHTGRGGRWNVDNTDKFYDAIGMFGADFSMIQKMFPERTRRQVKLKFVREEKADPDRMREAMVGPTEKKIPMSLGVYAEMTGTDLERFRDPVALEEELEGERVAQQRELEEEAKAREDGIKEKREKARERQKEKEKARRERKKGEKAGQGPREQSNMEEEFGVYDGEPVESIET